MRIRKSDDERKGMPSTIQKPAQGGSNFFLLFGSSLWGFACVRYLAAGVLSSSAFVLMPEERSGLAARLVWTTSVKLARRWRRVPGSIVPHQTVCSKVYPLAVVEREQGDGGGSTEQY